MRKHAIESYREALLPLLPLPTSIRHRLDGGSKIWGTRFRNSRFSQVYSISERGNLESSDAFNYLGVDLELRHFQKQL